MEADALFQAASTRKADPHAGSLYIQGGLLFQSKLGAARMYIPDHSDWRRRVLVGGHDVPWAGHFGVRRTTERIQRNFWWPSLRDDVKVYCASCTVCQRAKGSTQLPFGIARPLGIPNAPFAWVSMDMAYMPKTAEGYDSVWIFCDVLTKFVVVVPAMRSWTGEDVARAYLRYVVFAGFGMARRFISDRDPRFTSNFWSAFTSYMGIHRAMATSLNPQTDGQTERMVRTWKTLVRTCLLDLVPSFAHFMGREWVDRVPELSFAYNDSIHVAHRFSPMSLVFGRCANLALPLLAGVAQETAHVPHDVRGGWAHAAAFLQQKQQNIALAKSLIRIQKRQMQRAMAKRYRLSSLEALDGAFAVGSYVWLRADHAGRTGAQRDAGVAATALWDGPFQIRERGAVDGVVKLSLPQEVRVHSTVNIKFLKPYFSRPEYLAGE